MSVTRKNGVIEYRDDEGRLHRPSAEGPARIRPTGSVLYYEHGQIHRPSVEGPAVTWPHGSVLYYEHGQIHRPVSEGPAIVRPNGPCEYWERGERVPDGEVIRRASLKAERTALLMLETYPHRFERDVEVG